MRIDLVDYLCQLQKQRDQMMNAFEEAKEKAEKGELDQSVANNVVSYYNVIEDNYQRVLHCVYLMNRPPKFISKLIEKLQGKPELPEGLELSENKEALEKLYKEVEELKDET